MKTATHGSRGGFGYYNGALYTTANPIGFDSPMLAVIKNELDGTDHREVAQVDIREAMRLGYSCTFHHGKLFIEASTMVETDEDDHLIVLDLSDYSVTEPAADYLRTARLPLIFSFYKDKLYGVGSGSRERLNVSNGLMEVDAVTGEIRKLTSDCSGKPYATDHTLYFLQ